MSKIKLTLSFAGDPVVLKLNLNGLAIGNLVTLNTEQEITGGKVFHSLSLPGADAIFESNGENFYSGTATFNFQSAAAASLRTAIGLGTLATQSGTFSGTHSGNSSGTNTGDQNLSGYATFAGLNIFTGTSVYQGGSGSVVFNIPTVEFNTTAVFTGIINFDDASEFTYSGPTALAHRVALELGPLATSDGSGIAYLAASNTYTGIARFDSNTIQFIDNSFTVSGSTVANFKTAFGLGSVRKVAVPATAASTGAIGDVAFDASFFYSCHAVNTWRRVAISSW